AAPPGPGAVACRPVSVSPSSSFLLGPAPPLGARTADGAVAAMHALGTNTARLVAVGVPAAAGAAVRGGAADGAAGGTAVGRLIGVFAAGVVDAAAQCVLQIDVVRVAVA